MPSNSSSLARLTLSLALLPLVGLANAATSSGASPALEVRADAPVYMRVENVQWELDGPFALRHMTVRMVNLIPRALEATLKVPLAANEQLRGFALDVDGRMVDAVPVERVKARIAFESTVRSNVDPALVEKDEGNSYRIRVFPVPPMGLRTARITVASVAERASCGWEHRLTLPAGTPRATPVRITALGEPMNKASLPWVRAKASAAPESDADKRSAQWKLNSRSNRLASGSVCLRAPRHIARFEQVLPDGTKLDWVEVPVGAPSMSRAVPRHLEVVWDVSGSQPLNRKRELSMLSNYLYQYRADLQKLTVTVLRNTLQRRTLDLSGNDTSATKALLAELAALPNDGATALRMWRPAPGAEAVLMFSDATNTWPSVESLPAPDLPVHLVTGRVADPALAHLMTAQGGSVTELDGPWPQQLGRQLFEGPPVRLAPTRYGDTWWTPSGTGTGRAVRACRLIDTGEGVTSDPPVLIHHSGRAESKRSEIKDAPKPSTQLAHWCGQWWMNRLQADPERNRTQMATVGQRFGVVGPETSLLVLERPEDYVRQGIEPAAGLSAELRAAWVHLRELEQQAKQRRQHAHLDTVSQAWRNRQQWWEQAFPKDLPPAPKNQEARPVGSSAPPMPTGMAAPPPARLVSAPPVPLAMAAASPVAQSAAAATPIIGIQLQSVAVQSPYAADLALAENADAAYARYLDLRHAYQKSPAFYFDAADRLFELGDKVRAIQVLSNVVELMPREAVALRPVAYRLQQAGHDALALELLRQVALLAPDEPTSHRDLGLALAGAGNCEAAQQRLSHVVLTPWDMRFRDVGVTTLADLHDRAIACPGMDLNRLPESLRRPLPVGLRVVLKWNLNDTDIDLHVKDPNGETAYFGNPKTYQGGRMSADFMAGYGPEEFVLKEPKPGVYEVRVKYYGSHLATLSRGAVVQVELQSHFGVPQRQSAALTLRLLEESGLVLVGRFTVGERGQLRTVP